MSAYLNSHLYFRSKLYLYNSAIGYSKAFIIWIYRIVMAISALTILDISSFKTQWQRIVCYLWAKKVSDGRLLHFHFWFLTPLSSIWLTHQTLTVIRLKLLADLIYGKSPSRLNQVVGKRAESSTVKITTNCVKERPKNLFKRKTTFITLCIRWWTFIGALWLKILLFFNFFSSIKSLDSIFRLGKNSTLLLRYYSRWGIFRPLWVVRAASNARGCLFKTTF